MAIEPINELLDPVNAAASYLMRGLLQADGNVHGADPGRLYAIVVDLYSIAGKHEYADAIALLSKVARKRGWIK